MLPSHGLRYFTAIAALIVQLTHAANPTCLDLPPSSTVGWSNSSQVLSYVSDNLAGNCGYLTMIALNACNNCSNPRACCGTACGWNSAGCGCFAGELAKMAFDIPGVENTAVFDVALLQKSTCNFGPIFAGNSCNNLPTNGIQICNRAKPARDAPECKAKPDLQKKR